MFPCICGALLWIHRAPELLVLLQELRYEVQQLKQLLQTYIIILPTNSSTKSRQGHLLLPLPIRTAFVAGALVICLYIYVLKFDAYICTIIYNRLPWKYHVIILHLLNWVMGMNFVVSPNISAWRLLQANNKSHSRINSEFHNEKWKSIIDIL